MEEGDAFIGVLRHGTGSWRCQVILHLVLECEHVTKLRWKSRLFLGTGQVGARREQHMSQK